MKKKIITTLLLIAIIMLISTTGAYANYQIKPNGGTRYSLNNLMNNVRSMETSGQVMGLNETHDTTTLEPIGEDNGIDVHMLKNTEYGACVLLSASPKYGKQGEGSNSYIHKSTTTGIATTTGNQYGVYQMGDSSDYEWTAGGGKTSYYNNGYNAVPYSARYYNVYDPLTAKPGDATTETSRWKGSSNTNFVSANSAFKRGYSGAFSYNYLSSNGTYYGRAAVVCGWSRRTLMWF